MIAGLTRFRNLLVIAPHSASVFKDSALPRERIAQRLGVRYLVGGSLQRAGDRLRLRVQLSETQGGVLWSEHYDGEMGDVFALTTPSPRSSPVSGSGSTTLKGAVLCG